MKESVLQADAVPQSKCLIIEDDTLVAMGLRATLERLGHVVVGDACTAAEAEEVFEKQRPDLVLMDIRLGSDDGIELSRKLLAKRPVPIVIVSAYGDKELIDRAAAAGVFGYLIKPVDRESLSAQIEVAVNRFRDHMLLLAEKQALEHTLETRKLVEKAKGIMMKRMNLSEAEAHKRLQQESQKRRQSIGELAKKLIESEDVLHGDGSS
ncbi:MAG TPA: response regulator [Tepidisphaeraceae bacterium]|nr:response regulator [Tepidisphaeraceae bacterium]